MSEPKESFRERSDRGERFSDANLIETKFGIGPVISSIDRANERTNPIEGEIARSNGTGRGSRDARFDTEWRIHPHVEVVKIRAGAQVFDPQHDQGQLIHWNS